MAAPHPYVVVEGAIGVGKTTLTRILGPALTAEILLEVFEENPFLGDFYADRARYAFQTQIFFLLSRFRQQHKVIAQSLVQGPLVSDYLFAKDWLFAHLNLMGNELAMYERVHAILGEQIPTPALVIYLRASTATLMQRIALRDRAYERQISRDYIDDLRVAYEEFFDTYDKAPVLPLDTEDLDFVHDSATRASVISRVNSALGTGGRQLPLPEIDEGPFLPSLPQHLGRRLPDLQRLHRVIEPQAAGAQSDLFYSFIWLTQVVGELGLALKQVWSRQNQLLPQVGNRTEAQDRALETLADPLQEALADALDVLLRVANDAGVDLESAYFRKLARARREEGRQR